MDEIAASPDRALDLKRSLRSMVVARALAVPWALVQVLAYEQDYPTGYQAIGVVLVAVLAVGNIAFAVGLRRIEDETSARLVALGSLSFDIVLSMGFVVLISFDPLSALWAILFITFLEGAILFQLEGALGAWAVVTVLYTFREIWGSQRYDYELLWNSISFRMGIGLIIALVAGMMARDLVRQKSRLAEALHAVTKVDEMRAALVSTLAHDIRNPLTSIRGAHQLLLQKEEQLDAQSRRTLLESADRQSHRLQMMATDLLDLARLEQGRVDLQKEELDVKEHVAKAARFLEPESELRLDVEDGLTVMADPGRLEQILMNLATNAQTYGAPPYEIAAYRDGEEVVIEFRDRGDGVSDAARDTLFDAFGTRSGKGVGFGLSIVKAMVEAHGGRVTYRDNDPSGAIFQLHFPPVSN